MTALYWPFWTSLSKRSLSPAATTRSSTPCACPTARNLLTLLSYVSPTNTMNTNYSRIAMSDLRAMISLIYPLSNRTIPTYLSIPHPPIALWMLIVPQKIIAPISTAFLMITTAALGASRTVRLWGEAFAVVPSTRCHSGRNERPSWLRRLCCNTCSDSRKRHATFRPGAIAALTMQILFPLPSAATTKPTITEMQTASAPMTIAMWVVAASGSCRSATARCLSPTRNPTGTALTRTTLHTPSTATLQRWYI